MISRPLALSVLALATLVGLLLAARNPTAPDGIDSGPLPGTSSPTAEDVAVSPPRLEGRGAAQGVRSQPPSLATHAVLEGQVTTQDGSPVADAPVVAIVDGGDETTWKGSGSTDASGTYRIQGVPAGRLRNVRVLLPAYLHEWRGGDDVELGKVTRVDVVLQRGCVLAGTVQDVEGRPLAGAEVRATVGRNTRGAQADAEGRYRIEGIRTGTALVHAAPPGWNLPKGWELAREDARALARVHFGRDGQELRADLRLTRGLEIVGSVTLPGDRPAGGARVAVWLFNRLFQDDEIHPPVLEADADGRFSVQGLEMTDDWRIRARHGESVSLHQAVRLTDEEGPVEVKLRLLPAACIRGRVTGADGAAVSVRAYSRDTSALASANDDGTFVLDGLTAGRYDIHAEIDSSGRNSSDADLQVDWGGDVGGVELVFAPGFALGGVVVDQRGQPIPDLELALGHEGLPGRTDANGRFRFTDLPPYPASIRFLDDDTVAAVLVRPGEFDTRILHWLRPLRTIEGTVRGPDGVAVPDGHVSVSVFDPEGYGAQLGYASIRDGRFTVTFRSTSEDLHIGANGFRDALGQRLPLKGVENLRCRAGEGPVAIQLEQGLEIRGTIVDDEGLGVEGVEVKGCDQKVLTGPGGAFRLPGCGPGERWIKFRAPPEYVEPGSRRVEAGTMDVQVRLVPGHVLSGRVRGPNGQPVRGATVTARWRGSEPGWAKTSTDADGSFVLERLGGAEVDLKVVPRRGTTGSNALERRLLGVRTGGEELQIALERGVLIEGTVLDPDGLPVEYARVRVREHGVETPWAFRGEARRPTGRFRVGPLRAGTYEVVASGSDAHEGESEAVLTEAPALGLQLRLARVPVIRGRLTSCEHDVFRVYMQPLWEGGELEVTDLWGGDGEFAFGDLKPGGKAHVFATCQTDFRYALLEHVEVGREDVEFVLRTGLSIEGRVGPARRTRPFRTPSDSEPLTGGPEVRAEDDRGVRVRAPVDFDGTFVLRGLPPGRYTVSYRDEDKIYHGGSAPPECRVENVPAGARGVVIPLPSE